LLKNTVVKEKNRGTKKKCKKGLDNSGNIEGIFIFGPDSKTLVRREALAMGALA
jgi:hypothetical protein